MPSHEMRPYEQEENLFWPMGEWPIFQGYMPALKSSFTGSDLSVWEEKDHVIVEAPLPGISADGVDLTFERGVLTIRGQKKEEKEDKDRKYFHRSSSSFVYRLNIPGEIDDTAEPEAKLENGVLRISFKKHKRAVPRKINVKS